MKKTNKKKGFTIVELVIVIAVIAILATVLIPTFSSVITDANDTAAVQKARNIYTQYVQDNAKTGVEEKVAIKVDGKFFMFDDGQINETPVEEKPEDYFVICDEHVDAEKDKAEGTEGKGKCDDCGNDMPA